MKYLIFVIPFFMLLGLQPEAIAQKDINGSEDHPLLTRYPETHIASYEKIKYREYTFAYGPTKGYKNIDEKLSIAGQLYRITYVVDIDVTQLSIGEVYLDYKQAIEKAGIEIMADGLDSNTKGKAHIGGAWWIGISLGYNPFPQNSKGKFLFAGTSTSGGTFSIMGKLRRPDGLTYLAVHGERHSNDKIVIHVDILEEKAAETGFVFADAAYMKKEMEEKGMVIIYGINFDFDSNVIKEDSKPVIEEIATFLKSNPNISIYIVGHTDMKGTLTYNIGLSERRAIALVEKLHKDYNIDKSRLTPDGVGPLAPVATNDTEEGRSLNRRVELVKRAD